MMPAKLRCCHHFQEDDMSDNAQYERYQRQMLLKNFGESGQRKLLNSKILVVGAGGLGCAALQYLAAAGVGVIGIVDDDVVSLNNLHRQVLYSVNDIGLQKAETASAKLALLNPDIEIIPLNVKLTNQNAMAIIGKYDVIIDGTDNFSSRYVINDACVLLNKPLVYGAVSQFEGQVAVFNCGRTAGERAVNYRDLFPNPPKENEVLNCAEGGVLGVLPGIIGTMQANEAIKLLTGIGEPLADRLLTFNALTNDVYVVKLSPGKKSELSIPKNEEEFLATDYEWLCSSQPHAWEINVDAFNALLKENNVTVIDVREFGEQPRVNEFEHVQIPLSMLKHERFQPGGDTIALFCQTGKRSLEAVHILKNNFGASKKIYSLRGGITEWKKVKG
jgi:molybdopterin/thiamine biosynthesis adenylyltransferase/rhodanese-related sulfurtransferase